LKELPNFDSRLLDLGLCFSFCCFPLIYETQPYLPLTYLVAFHPTSTSPLFLENLDRVWGALPPPRPIIHSLFTLDPFSFFPFHLAPSSAWFFFKFQPSTFRVALSPWMEQAVLSWSFFAANFRDAARCLPRSFGPPKSAQGCEYFTSCDHEVILFLSRFPSLRPPNFLVSTLFPFKHPLLCPNTKTPC